MRAGVAASRWGGGCSLVMLQADGGPSRWPAEKLGCQDRRGRDPRLSSPRTGFFFFPLGGVCRGIWQKRKAEVEKLKGPGWINLGPAGLGLGDVG